MPIPAAGPRGALLAALGELPFLQPLDADALAALARAVRRRSFAAGESIVQEGADCDGLYFVVSGEVRLFRTGADGRRHVTGVLGPGSTFNDVPVFDGGPVADAAMAASDSVVGLIPAAAVGALLDRHPQVARAALRHLSARQRAIGGVAEDLALRDVTARVARLLLGCVGRDRHIVENAPAACEHITHQEIAAMVGSVREVVQRALKRLEREGSIALGRSRIEVRDPRRLARWADAAAPPS